MRIAIALLVVVCLADFVSAQKVLVIGIDGMGFGAAGFDVASTPNMDSLIAGTWRKEYRGAYSDNAFSGGVIGTATEQPTISGPSWATIHCGVWVDRHGVTGNDSLFINGNYTDNPPWIGTLKDHNPDLMTASFIRWVQLDTAIMGAVDSDASPDNDLDFRGTVYGTDAAIAMGVNSMMNQFDAAFVHLLSVDTAGHQPGVGSSGMQYETTIELEDMLVGQMLTQLAARPNFDSEDWLIMIVADHGHRPTGGHGGQTELERRVPFIVSNKYLRQGDLPVSVSIADVAPTVLDHFGIPIPDHYWGQPRNKGFLIGDVNRDQVTNLLDVSPFIDVMSSGMYQSEADVNQDGAVNLLDVSPFIALIGG